MQRVLGMGWLFIGIVMLGMGVMWLMIAERVRPFFAIAAQIPLPCVWQPFLNAPSYGDYLPPVLGFFLIVLGTRLALRVPGTRVVAAFVHVASGLILLVAAYVVLTSGAGCLPERWHYIVPLGIALVGGLHLLGAIKLTNVAHLTYARDDNNFPFPHCPQCGRTLDEQNLCPLHDIPVIFARLINQNTGHKYDIELSRPATIGTGKVDVWLNPQHDPDYRVITGTHAKITYSPETDRFTLADLQSTNHTFINEVQLDARPTPLAPDVIIKLGSVPFKFEVVKRLLHEVDASPNEVFKCIGSY